MNRELARRRSACHSCYWCILLPAQLRRRRLRQIWPRRPLHSSIPCRCPEAPTCLLISFGVQRGAPIHPQDNGSDCSDGRLISFRRNSCQSELYRPGTVIAVPLQTKLNQELERTPFIQGVCDLAEAGCGEFFSGLGELRGIEEIHRFGAKGQAALAADLPRF